MQTTPRYLLALRYLQAHEGEHLTHDQHRLVDRCIDYLVADSHASHPTARDITMQAFGEFTARHRREYIDCSRTTSYALFLIDDKGERIALTLSELLQLIELSKTGRAA